MSTQEILDRIKTVCEAATDGPMYKGESNDAVYTRLHPEDGGFDAVGCFLLDCDEEFYILSRTALLPLVEAVEELLRVAELNDGWGMVYPQYIKRCIADALAPLKDQLP